MLKFQWSFLRGWVLGRFWDPAGIPKSTKNGPGDEKVRPETVPEAIFVDFSLRCRSESLSGSIFGGSDPSKLCSHHNGSTILTKSPFSKKHRKSSLRGPVLGPKMVKSRRRGDPKSPKMVKKSEFFRRFFACEKNRKKSKNRRYVHLGRKGSAVLRRPPGR